MDLFGLVRITWLPRKRNARTAWPPHDRAESVAEPPKAEPPEGKPPEGPEGKPPEAGPPVAGPLRSDPSLELPPRHDPPQRPDQTPPATAAEPDVVWPLIGLADDLAELLGRSWTAESAARTLQLVRWRVDKVLTDYGVQVISDEGPVVPARHEVVGSERTSTDDRVGRIAATVRPGYLLGNQLLRPQQVVAYITTGTAAKAEGDNDADRG